MERLQPISCSASASADQQRPITPAVPQLFQPPQRVACQQRERSAERPRAQQRRTHAQVCASKQRICGNERRRRGKKSCPEQTDQSTTQHLCNTMTALPLSPGGSTTTPDKQEEYLRLQLSSASVWTRNQLRTCLSTSKLSEMNSSFFMHAGADI